MPKGFLESLAANTKNRQDTEREQALIRVVITPLYTLYTLWVLHRREAFGTTEAVALLTCAISVTFSVALLRTVLKRPGVSRARRVAGILHDNTLSSIYMLLLGEAGAPVFVVFLWVAFGNGFRYGRKYLYGSAAAATAGFSAVLALSPYWRAHATTGISLLIAIVALPLYVSVLIRILERRQEALQDAAAALFHEKEMAQITLHSIRDGVIVTDASGKITTMNDAAEKITGWAEKDAVGEHVSRVFACRYGPSEEVRPCTLETALSDGKEAVSESGRLIARDLSVRTVTESAAPIRSESGVVVGGVLVFRDVTARRRMEEEVLKIRKIESLGVLAGGIAHDFNNYLAAILGNIDLAKTDAPSGSRQRERLENAEKASLLAKGLSVRLLTFSKGGSPVRKVRKIGPVVQEAADFALRGSHVRFEYDFPENLWPVEIDAGQVSQAVHGIVVNAVQAMPHGGTVQMSAKNVFSENGGRETAGDSKYVLVTISDDGVGIPKENIERVFDPYFTTKRGGSGLGLATAYNILKNHGGHISVSSDMGIGTTFLLYFPASEGKPVEEPAARWTPEGAAPTRREGATGRRVLVMDDEEMVRDMLCQMLASLGYDPYPTLDGEDAIDAYVSEMEAGRGFDAAIMDLTIPGGMGGREAAQRLKAAHPEARIIVSSGYSDSRVMAEHQEYGFCGALPKPYKMEDLKAVLDEALGAGA